MNDTMLYTCTPPPDLVTQSDLNPFLRVTGQTDYDVPAAKADADPAWLMEEIFKFCDVRFYRPDDTMPEYRAVHAGRARAYQARSRRTAARET